jgi:hypothetical protein
MHVTASPQAVVQCLLAQPAALPGRLGPMPFPSGQAAPCSRSPSIRQTAGEALPATQGRTGCATLATAGARGSSLAQQSEQLLYCHLLLPAGQEQQLKLMQLAGNPSAASMLFGVHQLVMPAAGAQLLPVLRCAAAGVPYMVCHTWLSPVELPPDLHQPLPATASIHCLGCTALVALLSVALLSVAPSLPVTCCCAATPAVLPPLLCCCWQCPCCCCAACSCSI